MKSALVSEHIIKWLDSYKQQSRTEGFVVGISGGIDSAVTSTLSCLTGHPTLCVEMPIHQHSAETTRANEHITNLCKTFVNCSRIEVDLTETYNTFEKAIPKEVQSERMDLPFVNSRARLRMTTLYYLAAQRRALVVGTGNKIEDFGIGFYTKYGDGGVDLSPIADLLKNEVYQLGRHLNVCQSILQAAPTDGLWEDQRTDEDQIGATYTQLEWAMNYLETNQEDTLSTEQKRVLALYQKLHNANKHKMVPIPICEIPKELK